MLVHPKYFVLLPGWSRKDVCIDGASWFRKDAIESCVKGSGRSWKYLYKEGWRIVKVKIEICPTKRAVDVKPRQPRKVKSRKASHH